MSGRRSRRPAMLVVGLVMLFGGCAARESAPAADAVVPWVSHAVPEARGDVAVATDGTRRAIRYRGWSTEDFSRYRTYAYDDARAGPAPAQVPMPRITGDPARGRKLFLDRNVGPCTGCHLVQGADVWPAGNVGPDLSTYGDRHVPDEHTFKVIYDARHVFPNTIMPPWGTAGVLRPDQIVDLVAFLATQRSPVPPEASPERDPETRPRPVGFGDNLDATNNPAVLRAEAAESIWQSRGPRGRACADCHPGGVAIAMRRVATRWPQYIPQYRRVMSIEDYLAVHAAETTGRPLPAESSENLDVTVLVKMASNGMPVALDLARPEHAAALERGKRSFYRRVGQRNHACADCHTAGAGHGADKFLGGRLLAGVQTGLTRHFPTWRTSQADLWSMRRRMQWCMTPLGANMLAADAVEYAELELYLASFDQGKPMSVPGIRH